MKKLLGALVVFALIVGACGIFANSQDGDNPFSGIFNSTVNAALDSTGLKDKVQDALYDNVDTIAKKTGLPSSEVKKMVDDLDVTNWEATTLPGDAETKSSNTIQYNGTTAKVTTYDDPSLITIDSNGVPVTFKVPASAQSKIQYLSYM